MLVIHEPIEVAFLLHTERVWAIFDGLGEQHSIGLEPGGS